MEAEEGVVLCLYCGRLMKDLNVWNQHYSWCVEHYHARKCTRCKYETMFDPDLRFRICMDCLLKIDYEAIGHKVLKKDKNGEYVIVVPEEFEKIYNLKNIMSEILF